MKAYFSDVVWNVPVSGENTKIVFLFEHKTDQKGNIFLQLLRYYIQIWDNNIKKGEKLTPIIPCIVYQSGGKWETRSFEDYFAHFDPEFRQFTPFFSYLLFETTEQSERMLREMEAYHSYLVFKAMRQVAIDQLNEQDLIVLLQEFDLPPDSEAGKILMEMIFFYTFAHSEASPDEVMHKIDSISQSKSNFMSTLHQMFVKSETKGKAEGISIGEARGKAEGKAEGKALAAKILKHYLKGTATTDIATQLNIDIAFVSQTIAEYEAA